ncbi:small multi-drug export protein [Egicoccus sp. AB-alg6-2]|uniref:small multi-drug export protein n=1 Tax=Egicoccus sp. AB-alg6-2 TaxID=3242692 RepID=UPI00359D9ACA
MELSFEAGSWWSYALVFLAAATPVLEVLVVIPAAVLAGMPPGPTTLLALAGNLSTVVLVGVAGDRIIESWRARRPDRDRQPSRRTRRARELAQRWGVPGLAFLAPLTTGTHVATVAALATGAGTRRVLRWMAAGLVFWSLAVVVVTVAGFEAFR